MRQVAEAQGLLLESRDYLAPIITAHEAQLAFSPGAQWTGDYRLDMQPLAVRRQRRLSAALYSPGE